MSHTSRRSFIAGLGAIGLTPRVSGISSSFEVPVASTKSWWGSGHIMTSLGNTALIAGRTVSQSFRAVKTGFIKSVLWYNVRSSKKPGYSLGTGGNIRVRIEGCDADGYANGIPVGGSHTLENAVLGPIFPKQILSAPAPVEAGKVYHVTFFNTHADANFNYVSTDCINISPNPSPHNPQIPDEEDSVYYRNSGGIWRKRPQTPILDLEYADGTHQGVPYIECWLPANSRHHDGQITTTQWSRQSFQLNDDIIGIKVAVAVRRISGAGDLIMEIGDETGHILRDTVWNGSEILSTYQGWAPSKSIAPLKLTRGSQYFFLLKATSGVFSSYPLANGSIRHGFSKSIAITGFCEFTMDRGVTWSGGWRAWNRNGRKDGTMIFYFETT